MSDRTSSKSKRSITRLRCRCAVQNGTCGRASRDRARACGAGHAQARWVERGQEGADTRARGGVPLVPCKVLLIQNEGVWKEENEGGRQDDQHKLAEVVRGEGFVAYGIGKAAKSITLFCTNFSLFFHF